MPAAHALLYAGASLPGLQVLDNIRGLDYLQSRPEVDPAAQPYLGGDTTSSPDTA